MAELSIRCVREGCKALYHRSALDIGVRENHSQFTVQGVASLAGLSPNRNGYYVGAAPTDEQNGWLSEHLGYRIVPAPESGHA